MDAILILGAAVWPDGPSPTLQRRTLHAAALWHQQVAPVVIPCGGLGVHAPTEAATMRTILLAEGVPDHAIQLEDQSTTTFENLRNGAALMPGKRVMIVTDRYHARRAALVARYLGLEAHVSSPHLAKVPLRQNVPEALALVAYAIRLRGRHKTLNQP